jgi:hypothetical protein
MRMAGSRSPLLDLHPGPNPSERGVDSHPPARLAWLHRGGSAACLRREGGRGSARVGDASRRPSGRPACPTGPRSADPPVRFARCRRGAPAADAPPMRRNDPDHLFGPCLGLEIGRFLSRPRRPFWRSRETKPQSPTRLRRICVRRAARCRFERRSEQPRAAERRSAASHRQALRRPYAEGDAGPVGEQAFALPLHVATV